MIKTEFKHIVFEAAGEGPFGKPAWSCFNRKELKSARENGRTSAVALSWIYWYKPWKDWAMVSHENAVWSQNCLHDMAEFMDGLKALAAAQEVEGHEDV